MRIALKSVVGRNGSKGRFVRQISRAASVLKLTGKEESGRDINASDVDALGVGAAGCDLVSPESKSPCVRFAIQEIVVVLTHKEARVVDQVGRWPFRTVYDRHSR